MSRNLKIIIIAVAAIASMWLVYRVAGGAYFAPRARLLKQINDDSKQLEVYRNAEEDFARVKVEIQQRVNRTLGGNRATVDHRLRTRLNRLAEHVGIEKSVDTAPVVKPRESPAKAKFVGAGSRELRDEIDFVEVEGWVSGTATFEQALRLVAFIDADPWIKRIDRLRLVPKDNGERFEVYIGLTTVFLPGREPDSLQLPEPDAGAAAARLSKLVAANPFRVPPAVPAQAQAVAQAPAAFAYETWFVTGVARGPGGIEVWLLNHQTREARCLAIGESLHEAALLAADNDAAHFRIGQQKFFVTVGKSFGDRVAVNQ
ncbi:MAG: hypothetical protein L0Y44_09485 [Phycisphaerales bacterium]|nr:hypothetical protein [Phycisphaerales bacterium]MCI0675259.1 hypothetical protein [Phycisphaerales bacterium]